MNELDYLKSDFEKCEYLQSILIARSTGGDIEDSHYLKLRNHFVSNPNYSDMLPSWVRTNRSLDQFWQFIKNKFPSYAERREFLYAAFTPLLDYLENKQTLPASKTIESVLSKFDEDGIHFAWQKALERKVQDPEGAITISRTILESVCKHILDAKGVEFNDSGIELSELYKLTAKELNLSPDQHSEKIFKQILGGCSGIVNGLGALRNRHGDAHGQLPRAVKPKPRHAELAVNLSGTMALFLIETFNANK